MILLLMMVVEIGVATRSASYLAGFGKSDLTWSSNTPVISGRLPPPAFRVLDLFALEGTSRGRTQRPAARRF
jgi:hypothetical protein